MNYLYNIIIIILLCLIVISLNRLQIIEPFKLIPCKTDSRSSKKASRGNLTVIPLNMYCVRTHKKSAKKNAKATIIAALRFPYDIYTMPDFDYKKIDGEPTVNNVP
jgi:hypothetical protein